MEHVWSACKLHVLNATSLVSLHIVVRFVVLGSCAVCIEARTHVYRLSLTDIYVYLLVFLHSTLVEVMQAITTFGIWGWAFNDHKQSSTLWLRVRIAAKFIIPTYPWVIHISIYLWLKYPHPTHPNGLGGMEPLG